MDLRFLHFLILLTFLPLSNLAQDTPAVFLDGLPGIHALSCNPQGALFATIPDSPEIVQVLAPRLTRTLLRTGGRLAGLAFDTQGTLYVAALQKKAILKVTPWGESTIAADRCHEAYDISIEIRPI